MAVGDELSAAVAGIAGRVQEIHYFGHDTIMLVRPDDGAPLVRARVAGAGHIDAGTAVTLTARGPVPAFRTDGVPTAEAEGPAVTPHAT